MTTNIQENKMAGLESEGLKSTMTINKAITLMQDRHSVSESNISSIDIVVTVLQSFMIQRHQRALHRIAENNKSGYVSKIRH